METKNCKPADKKKCILLVESEEHIRTLLAEELREEGYSVTTTDSGSDALAIIETNQQELYLVITDLKHPGLDARTLLLKIKDRWPELPVIFNTAYNVSLD